jgi:hypothetical protein
MPSPALHNGFSLVLLQCTPYGDLPCPVPFVTISSTGPPGQPSWLLCADRGTLSCEQVSGRGIVRDERPSLVGCAVGPSPLPWASWTLALATNTHSSPDNAPGSQGRRGQKPRGTDVHHTPGRVPLTPWGFCVKPSPPGNHPSVLHPNVTRRDGLES